MTPLDGVGATANGPGKSHRTAISLLEKDRETNRVAARVTDYDPADGAPRGADGGEAAHVPGPDRRERAEPSGGVGLLQ